ncbi:MAG: competence/damage-inducible protein A [Thermoleophilaceae bacterium]|nr:competence/damage-inducible protein A [Thermoleophilaceae bacterium]
MDQIRAGIVVTGTEVLTARIVDRNGPWLSERLRQLGFDVVHITICRDRPEDIRAQLDFMHEQGLELICTTGGLGPTADDLTASIVGEFCDREMYLDEPTLEKINEIIAGFTLRMNWDAEALAEGSRKQAVVPRGADILGPAGTAPGLVVTGPEGSNKPVVVVLPGPPGELHAIWKEAVETDTFKSLAARTVVFEEQMIRMIGVPESDIAKTLREFDETAGLGDMEITTCLRKGEMEILISHRPEDRPRREALVNAFSDQYSGAIFSQSAETVDEQIARLLDGRTIALAESCTGGLLAHRLTLPAGASEFFQGSAVTYSNEAKARVLSVPQAELDDFGAVSPEVAKSMAEGALDAFEADFAVSITGIAGPDGGTKEKPVGTVEFHAVARDGRRRQLGIVLPGRRHDVQERAATVALHLLRSLIADPD